MIKTLVGKMDGDRMIPIAREHQMTMAGDPVPDDIVEILGRVYVCTLIVPGAYIFYEEVTHAFRLLEGGDNNG